MGFMLPQTSSSLSAMLPPLGAFDKTGAGSPFKGMTEALDKAFEPLKPATSPIDRALSAAFGGLKKKSDEAPAPYQPSDAKTLGAGGSLLGG